MSEMRLLFQYHHEKEVEDITQSDINDYIIYIKKVHVLGYAKCRSVAHACSFFYKNVIQKPFLLPTTLYPRKEFKLPNVMTTEESAQLFRTNHPMIARLVLSLLYGCGLRISEVENLKIVDIESSQNRIKICQAKGNKDRMVLLPQYVLETLCRSSIVKVPVHIRLLEKTGRDIRRCPLCQKSQLELLKTRREPVPAMEPKPKLNQYYKHLSHEPP